MNMESSLVNKTALNQCLTILKQYIVLHSLEDIRQRFTKLDFTRIIIFSINY